jgi:hypothetical protein
MSGSATPPSGPPALRQLEATLLEKSLAAAARGADDPALVPTVESLQAIRVLLDREREDLERRRRRQFGFATLLAVILIALASWMPVRSAEVDAHLVTTGVTIQSSASQPLTGLLPVRELVVSRATRVALPSEFGPWTVGADLRLTAGGEPIVMEPIAIAPGDRVTIEQQNPGRYRFTLESRRAIELPFSLVGQVNAVGDAGAASAKFTVPRQVTASWAAGQPVSLTFVTDTPALTQSIAVDELQLLRVESSDRARRMVSTIAGGDVAFPEFQDKVHTLRPGERLAFSGLRGRVSTIANREESLTFTVAGKATGLQVGTASKTRRLFPSMLEYVATSLGWNSVWVALGILAGIIGALWPIWTEAR